MVMKSSIPRMMMRQRELKRWSQSTLAKRAGLSKSSINEIESGLAMDLRVSTLLKICKALGATPDLILGFSVATRADQCGRCGLAIRSGELHGIPSCMLEMWESHFPLARIASVHCFTIESVERILTDEYEIRRRRRGALAMSRG